MRAIGLDVHLEFCEVAIAEGAELRSAGRIATRPEEIELFARSLGARDRVALEVTGNAWEIKRLIEPHVAEVIVVSPGDTAIRSARAKTDRLDARALARLLAAGELEAVWVPDRRTQVMRRRLQRRGQLVSARSRAKNQIHASLMRCLVGRAPFSDLFGAKGRRWLAELELAEEERESVDSALRQVEFLDSEIEAVERLISAAALESAEVRRLMTVPGVNVICAATFMAAVGEIHRFPSPRKLVAYLGLDPKVRQSGSGPGRPRAGLEAGLGRRAPRAGRGELVDGPPAGAGPRLLGADPGPTRPPGRDRRLRAKARLPVLVPAHPLRGLRLRAAVVDAEEAAPARACRRRPKQARDEERPHGCQRGEAQGRARARSAGRGRLQAHGQRLAGDPGKEKGRRRDTGARISRAVKRPSSAAGPGPRACALAGRLPAPEPNSRK